MCLQIPPDLDSSTTMLPATADLSDACQASNPCRGRPKSDASARGKPSVPDAKACMSAGIMVRMVTGDNIYTAKAIAKECGILTDGGMAIQGPEFRNKSSEEMRELIPKIQAMARSSPLDKHTLVKHLRTQFNDVVAVTGNGTNDAPLLHEADIGLAMGIAGAEVAKESADVIMLDDNFATINVARWGRMVYTNIQKFVQFQLTANIVALVINFVSACITGSAPLTAVQLLWVNMIMDALRALALATEPPNDDMMKRPPFGRGENFITKVMWRNIIGQSLYPMVNPQRLRKIGLASEALKFINTFIHMMEGSHGISADLSMQYMTILDSGAAFHCTGDRSQLSDYRDGVAPVLKLRGAGGTEMRVHGTGSIHNENFQVKGVLYVPGLNNQPNISKTIFSVSKLNDLGFNIVFNADGTVSVMNLEHGLVGKARNFRGLFMLDYLRIPVAMLEGRRPGLVKSFWNASLLVWTSITSRLSQKATYAQRPPV